MLLFNMLEYCENHLAVIAIEAEQVDLHPHTAQVVDPVTHAHLPLPADTLPEQEAPL